MSEHAKVKADLRQRHGLPVGLSGGKLAQALRRHKCYRQSTTLYVDGTPLLHQTRINALLDGKQLCMPSPALKKGFFLCRPFSIAHPDLPYAVSLPGITSHGTCLSAADLPSLAIDLAVCDALAIDEEGRRLGDGTGFFDLAMAILAEYDALATPCPIVSLIGQLCHDALPMAEWDLPVDFAVAEEHEYAFATQVKPPRLCWSALSAKKIKKIDLLWQLSQKKN